MFIFKQVFYNIFTCFDFFHMKYMNSIIIVVICITLSPTLISCYNLYDNNNSNVVNLNKKNFNSQIIDNRAKNIVSLVHYYSPDGILYFKLDGKSRGVKLELEKFASDNDGMFKVGALNCKDFKDICEKEGVKEYPIYKIYPPLPAPLFNYEVC